MAERTRTALMNLRVQQRIKDAAMRAAAADQRTLTSLVEKLLTDYCREHGFLPKFSLDQPATVAFDYSEEKGSWIENKRFRTVDQAIKFAMKRITSGADPNKTRVIIAEQAFNFRALGFEEMRSLYDTYLVPTDLEQGETELIDPKNAKARS